MHCKQHHILSVCRLAQKMLVVTVSALPTGFTGTIPSLFFAFHGSRHFLAPPVFLRLLVPGLFVGDFTLVHGFMVYGLLK